MAAYIIAFIEVTDPQRYAEYMNLTPDAIARHGGKFIVRGGEKVTLEGPSENRRVVVLEFPTFQQAETFYDSPEYRHAKSFREGAAQASFLLVDGCELPPLHA